MIGCAWCLPIRRSRESRCQGAGSRPALLKQQPLRLQASRWPLLKLCNGHRDGGTYFKSVRVQTRLPATGLRYPAWYRKQKHTASTLRSGLRLLLVGAKARSLSSDSAMNSRTDAATKKSLGPRKRELRVEVRKPLWPWATKAAKLETTRLRGSRLCVQNRDLLIGSSKQRRLLPIAIAA